MKSLSMFLIFLKQSVNRKLCFCVLFTTLIMCGAIVGLMDSTTASVWYLLDKAIVGSGVVSLMICVIPIIPYAISLAEEYETGMMKYYTIRTGRTSYLTNKIIVSFVSGFMTMFLSQVLFVLIFVQFFPLFNTSRTYYAYDQLMQNGEVIKGFVMYMTHMSLSGALMAVIAVFVSTIIPNKFAAVSLPVVIYFTLSRIFHVGGNLPKFLMPAYLIESVVGMENPVMELTLKFITVIVLSASVIVFGNIGLKRRIANA